MLLTINHTWFWSATARTYIFWKVGTIQGAFYLFRKTIAASIPKLPTKTSTRQL